MGVGFVECESEDCDEKIPDPPQPVRDKYGGAYCDECRKDINALGEGLDKPSMENLDLEKTEEEMEEAQEVLEKMEEGKKKGIVPQPNAETDEENEEEGEEDG